MIINSRAPNRIMDFGGWTDTHFAGSGQVLNIAVSLFAHVTMAPQPGNMVRFNILNYGETVEIDQTLSIKYDSRHDLLKAAINRLQIKEGADIDIGAEVPPGCGTGSSAALSVALVHALAAMRGDFMVPHEAAQLAHALETEELGLECGVQDQYAAAYGGINFIDIYEYPRVHISPVPVSSDVVARLESQLVLVYAGEGHLSSEIHREVMANLGCPGTTASAALEGLKKTARKAKQALMESNMELLADVMNENNSLQKALHRGITTESLERIETIGRTAGAMGAMINGAGGGGSISLLCRAGRKIPVVSALREAGFRCLHFVISFDPARAWCQ